MHSISQELLCPGALMGYTKYLDFWRQVSFQFSRSPLYHEDRMQEFNLITINTERVGVYHVNVSEFTACRRGQLADKAVKLAKRKASAALLPPVVMEGEPLEFDYLGCRFTSDADDAADMRHGMAIAGERSRTLGYLWRDNRLPRSLKLRLYAASVCLTLTHGSEAWTLTPRTLATLNGFNPRQLHRINGRSYREEATQPSYDLLTAVRRRRHQWLGQTLPTA